MNTFAERVRYARGLRRLTQAELARACRTSQSAIANYENGSRKFPRNLIQLAAALKVSAQWLAEGIGPIEHQAPALTSAQYRLAERSEEPTSLGWPFKNISPEIYWSLADTDRDLIENTIAGMISSLARKQ